MPWPVVHEPSFSNVSTPLPPQLADPPPLSEARSPTGNVPEPELLKVTLEAVPVQVVRSADGVSVTAGAIAASPLLSSTRVAVTEFGEGSGSAKGSAPEADDSCLRFTRACAST